MTLGTGCNMHGHVGTSCRSRCPCVVMGLNSQHWRIQERPVKNALRFFTYTTIASYCNDTTQRTEILSQFTVKHLLQCKKMGRNS